MQLSPRFFLAGVLAFSVACSSDAAGPEDPPDDPIIGVYTLRTINNQPLPFIFDQVGEDILEITAGVVSIFVDGTFTDVTDLRLTEAGQVSTFVDTGVGTWTRTANVVTFNVSGSPAYTMTWDGSDRLSQLIDGEPSLALVYER